MTQSNSAKPVLLHGLGLVSIVLPMTASAQTYIGGTGNWSTAASWNPASVPASGADIILSGTSLTGGTLTLDGSVSRVIGKYTHGDLGVRTNEFTLQTTSTANMTINGGITANGNFTGTGLRLRGSYIVSANQFWQIAGEVGTHAADRGVTFNEINATTVSTLTLNGKLTKSGTGQLSLAAVNVDGASDIEVSEGSLKLNAGGSLPLTLGNPANTGKIAVNNSATLIISKNSGTFAVNRAIQFNNTAKLETGSGRTDQTGTYDIGSDIAWNGSHVVTNNQNSGNVNVNYRFPGVMSGTGTITKGGASTMVLSGTGSNTLSGLVTVTAGELGLSKTSSATAIAGNLSITGGAVRMNQPNQIADTSNVSVSGTAQFIDTAGVADTIASLNISSTATSSLSTINVTGATTLSNGTHDVNSNFTFTTNSLAISNNAGIRGAGNAAGPSNINVGAGGLTLDSGKVIFGSAGAAPAVNLNLSGNVVSNGTSQFTPPNYSGPRVVDLQGGSRSFAINSGSLDIKTNVNNGTLVKSGTGTLILNRAGSTGSFSFTEGPVQIVSQADAANLSLSGGSLLMDIGGATPAKIHATGNVTSTGGTIEISAANAPITQGVLELVRYDGTLTGAPVINIPAPLAASRSNPVVDYGLGTNSAITITTSGVPLSLTWNGMSGGVWDNNGTANFTGIGSENFYALDSVTFGDVVGANPSIVLNSTVFPTDVLFDHGVNVGTYTLSGTGSISGATKLTKKGAGTTILATNNNYTGITDIVAGTLQIGNGGATGSAGTGAIQVASGALLKFARSGYAVVGNSITGAGSLENAGPGTVALTANNDALAGDVTVSGGTLQLGDGGATGSLGSRPVTVASGATFAVKRSGIVTYSNALSGAGSLALVGGETIINGAISNTHTGGVSVSDGGHLRVAVDTGLGDTIYDLVPNAIRLNHGGLKNEDSFTTVDLNRGISITGEAYFTAGWTKSLTIDSPITGAGNVFIPYDSGRVYFSNPTSDWTGSLTIGSTKPGVATGATAAILEVNSVNNAGVAGPLGKASADPANLVLNSGRLLYSGVDAASTNRGFTLQGSGIIEVSSSLAISGQVTGTGSLTKAGTGTLVLSGNNDFVGAKTLSGGSLVLASTNALGDANSTVTFTGTTGVLELATDTSVAPYSATIGAGNSGKILAGAATPGTPGFTHALGTLNISNITLTVDKSANVTGGDPRITFGNINLAAGAAGTGILNPASAGITFGSATISGGNFAKTLRLGGTHPNNHVTGALSDGINVLSLLKGNDSMWTLSGASTFTGNVSVEDGILALAHSQALGGTAKTLTISGNTGGGLLPEVQVSGGISPTVAVINISGVGANNTGALRNVSGDNTVTATSQINMMTGNGGTTLYSDAGTLTINTPLFTATNTLRTLFLDGPGNGVINGKIANGTTVDLPVVKNGTGTWTLNGAHTYTGSTTINGGVLSLGQAALSDTATVNIGLNGKLNINFNGVDRVGKLIINGEEKLNGDYSAATDSNFITGNGTIRVGPGPAGYGTWASSYPFTQGENDGPDQDADGDGISNLLEYVLGGIPVGPGANNTSILPTQAVGADNLVFTFRRSDASESDVTLKVQWSDNMGLWNDFATIGAVDAPPVDVTEDSPSAEIDTVSVTVPRNLTSSGKLFVRLQAIK